MMGDFVGYIGPLGVSVIVNFVAKKTVQNPTNYETVSVNIWFKLNITHELSEVVLYIL